MEDVAVSDCTGKLTFSSVMKMLLYYYIPYTVSVHQKKLQLKNQHTENKITLKTKRFSEEIRKVESLAVAML